VASFRPRRTRNYIADLRPWPRPDHYRSDSRQRPRSAAGRYCRCHSDGHRHVAEYFAHHRQRRRGDYVVADLPPSTYKILIEAKGFNGFQTEGILLEVGKDVRADCTLKTGDSTIVVTINEEIPLLDSTTSSLAERSAIRRSTISR